MPKLRVHSVAVSLDGFMAGPDQSLENPLGIGGQNLHKWAFATATIRARVFGMTGGETGLDDDFIRAGEAGIGANILGRNMFGPVRGRWEDAEEWRGWWGEEPPYHTPVFVLTHHQREPLELKGTTFHFVTDGIESALERAFDAAGGQDVRIGGGASTIAQYLRAGLVDEMHLAYVPLLLGAGERIFPDAETSAQYEVVEYVPSTTVAHVKFARRGN